MDNLSNLSYDEGWKDAEASVYKPEPEEPSEKPAVIKRSRPVVTLIQLAACLIIIAAAFIIKYSGGELYESLKSLYNTELNDEIIMNSDFESFRIDKSFAESAD